MFKEKLNKAFKIILGKLKFRTTKRNVILVGSIAVLAIAAISTGIYSLYKPSNVEDANAAVKNRLTSQPLSEKGAQSESATETPTLTGKEGSKTQTSGTAPANNADGKNSGKQKPAPFSINVTKSITVAAGRSTGTFTASTSDGTSVFWTTPSSEKAGSPYGYVAGKVMQPSSGTTSFDFYIRAEDNVKPGTYALTISGTSSPQHIKVTQTINVTVTAHPYYTITTSQSTYEVNDNQRIINIPYTISRYNSYSEKIGLTFSTKSAPGNNYPAFINTANTSERGGEIVFDASRYGFTNGVYVMAIYGSDGVNPSVIATFTVNVSLQP